MNGSGSYRFRVRFGKEGDLRFLSHHDLMRCMERAWRRSGLPLKMTEGFNPRPRMSFPCPLALGMTGTEEVMEVVLDQPVSPAEVQERLGAVLPADLAVRGVEEVEPGARGAVAWVEYRVPLEPEWIGPVGEALEAFHRAASVTVSRDTPPGRRTIDLKAYVRAAVLEGTELVMRLKVTPAGTARPVEVLEALGVPEAALRLYAGRRTRVALRNEKEGSSNEMEMIPT